MKTKPAKSRTRRPQTKKAQLIRILSAKSGTDVESISGKLGWQNHTTRAAISGLKKAGYKVSAEKESGKPRRYRITAEPQIVTWADSPPAVEANAVQVPANAG